MSNIDYDPTEGTMTTQTFYNNKPYGFFETEYGTGAGANQTSYEMFYKFVTDTELHADEFMRVDLKNGSAPFFHRMRTYVTKISDDVPEIFQDDDEGFVVEDLATM